MNACVQTQQVAREACQQIHATSGGGRAAASAAPTAEEASKYVVAIPSYKRPEILRDESLTALARQGVPRARVTVFVANCEEERAYRAVIGAGYRMVVGVKGYEHQLRFIMRHYPPGTPLVIFHDDIKRVFQAVGRKEDHKTREINLDVFFRKAFTSARERGLSLWGVNKVSNPFMMTRNTTTDLRLIEGNLYGFFNHRDARYRLRAGVAVEDIERTILHYIPDGGVLRFNDISKLSPTVTRRGGIEASVGGIPERLRMVAEGNRRLLALYPEYGAVVPNKKQAEVFILTRTPRTRVAPTARGCSTGGARAAPYCLSQGQQHRA